MRMEKTKLIEKRKAKGFTQSEMANKLAMNVSTYNRRENGQVKIPTPQWETLAKILGVSIEEIYEPDENQIFICRDSATGNYQGTNNIYPIPEYLLETQRKYIERLEIEIQELKNKLEDITLGR